MTTRECRSEQESGAPGMAKNQALDTARHTARNGLDEDPAEFTPEQGDVIAVTLWP